jgi:hypothetical protein
LPRHRLEQIAARERRACGFHRGLILAGSVIGKSLPRRLRIDAFRGDARQTRGGCALPGKIVTQHHAAPGGAVIGQEAVRHIKHDVALVAFPRAFLHEILDLEHQIVGKRAEQAEQRIVIGTEHGHQVAHQRHHTGAPGALVFIDRRRSAYDMAGEPGRVFLRDDDAGLAQHVTEERDQHLTALVQCLERKVGPGGFQPQRRIGKAEIEALIAARHCGARRQHHAAAAVQEVDQVVEPFGVAGELLHRPRHQKPAMGAVFAVSRQGEGCPVHVILLRNLPRKRHTGQTKRPSRCDDGL